MRAIDRGVRVSAGKYLMGIPMTVLASGSDEAVRCSLRVHAVPVGSGGRSVPGDAKDLLRRSIVREGRYVFVAIDAGKLHRSVN